MRSNELFFCKNGYIIKLKLLNGLKSRQYII
jgi:hypothetical protein